MAEFTGLTIDVTLNVSEETAQACVKLLNIYLERNCNKVSLMYTRPDDRFPYFSIQLQDMKTYEDFTTKNKGGDEE